ncbi:hypothetical protein SELMODRAFT_439165 [Selaginella moellendorffii]|uniref:Pentacotripeptide-repeat region of PRORP domain-containing protein n=1 Tax=Selaginella moellendorffii TaxID=88036 RepID=D8R0V9_SELML|nr:hypothetical protein SELMODRAFT_439165 [Selaginella moellendorffii]
MIQSVGVGVRILALCSGEKTDESARNSIVLSFGRHKGKRLSSVSNSYLSWMVANLPGDPWADLAQQHLSDRRSPLSSHWRWIESSLAGAQSLEEARAIQARIFANLPGAAEDAQVGNLLVQAMARLGGTKDARVAFARIKIKDAASWSAMIEGYSRNGQHRKAIDLYRRLLFQAEIEPNAAIFAAALEACGSLKMPRDGISVHARIAATGQELLKALQISILEMYGRLELGVSIRESTEDLDLGVENSVLNLFARCGGMERAWYFFRGMRERDAVSWNTMLWACAHRGLDRQALGLFREMDLEGVEANLFALRWIVRACSTSLAEECQGVYEWELDQAVANSPLEQ